MLLREREEGRKEGREENIDVREKHRLVDSRMHPNLGLYVPGLGLKPTT